MSQVTWHSLGARCDSLSGFPGLRGSEQALRGLSSMRAVPCRGSCHHLPSRPTQGGMGWWARHPSSRAVVPLDLSPWGSELCADFMPLQQLAGRASGCRGGELSAPLQLPAAVLGMARAEVWAGKAQAWAAVWRGKDRERAMSLRSPQLLLIPFSLPEEGQGENTGLAYSQIWE